MSFCTQTRDTPYSRATSLLLRPSIVTAVITSRAIDMAHLRVKEGANYVPRHLLTMSCNQSPSGALIPPAERSHTPSPSGMKGKGASVHLLWNPGLESGLAKQEEIVSCCAV